jgi:adenine deaminase
MSGAVNRRTVAGNVINPAECVTPYQALQAITYNAAYQLKEEKSKGSLKVGKLADLVILDKNPLKVDPLRIQDVRVMQTIKEGKTVYERKADGVAAADPSKEYSSEDPHTHLQTDRPLTKRQEKTLVMLMDRQK